MTYQQAFVSYGIPTTILARYNTDNVRKKVGYTILMEEEVNILISNVHICAVWEYSIDTYDLQLLVKNYIDKMGKNVHRLKKNG